MSNIPYEVLLSTDDEVIGLSVDDGVLGDLEPTLITLHEREARIFEPNRPDISRVLPDLDDDVRKAIEFGSGVSLTTFSPDGTPVRDFELLNVVLKA